MMILITSSVSASFLRAMITIDYIVLTQFAVVMLSDDYLNLLKSDKEFITGKIQKLLEISWFA